MRPLGDKKLICYNCGWSLVSKNVGDALPGEYFVKCPKCGSKVSWEKPSKLEKLNPIESAREFYYMIKSVFKKS